MRQAIAVNRSDALKFGQGGPARRGQNKAREPRPPAPGLNRSQPGAIMPLPRALLADASRGRTAELCEAGTPLGQRRRHIVKRGSIPNQSMRAPGFVRVAYRKLSVDTFRNSPSPCAFTSAAPRGPLMFTSRRPLPSTLCVCLVFAPSTPAECPMSLPASRGFAARLSGCNSLPSRRGAVGSAFAGLSEAGTCTARLPGSAGLAAAFRLEATTFFVLLPDRWRGAFS